MRSHCPVDSSSVSGTITSAGQESLIHYECEMIHKNDVFPPELASDIINAGYPEGDYHRVLYSEIM